MTNISLITEYTADGIIYTDEHGIVIGRTTQVKNAEGFNYYIFEELVKTDLIGCKKVALLSVGEWLALACKEEFDAQIKAETRLRDYHAKVVSLMAQFRPGEVITLTDGEAETVKMGDLYAVGPNDCAMQIMSDRWDRDAEESEGAALNRDAKGNWIGDVANENGWTP